MTVPLYIVAIIVLVMLSAFFSATETAFSSIGKIRLRSLEASNSKRSRLVVRLSRDYDSLISTILIGNNIVNIGATTLSTLLFAILIADPALSPTISTIVMTLVVLIFGEITPKSIAKRSPEFFAHAFAPVILVVFYLLYPLTWIFSKWQKLIGKLIKNKDQDAITDEELITMVDEATDEGGLNEYESNLIRSAIEFDDLSVIDIITPRVDVIALPIDADADNILRTFAESGYSRLPVYDGNIDNIVGILNEKDFYKLYIEAKIKGNKKQSIADIIDTKVIFAASHMKISTLLRTLQEKKTHLAIIVDEFGGTLGIVTLEDIIEELVGEIWDEHDEVENPFRAIDNGTFEIRGDVNLEDFFEYFSIEKNSDDYAPLTLSGLIVTLLDRVAAVGDVVEFEGLAITVKEVRYHKVERAIVTRNVENNEK